jgi:hypothetical protein
MVINDLSALDKKFVQSMAKKGYEYKQGIMPHLFSLISKNNRSALRKDYFFGVIENKISYAHIIGFIPEEIFQLYNLTSLAITCPIVENLMPPNFTYYLEKGLLNANPCQEKEYELYLDFLCCSTGNKIKKTDKESVLKVHELINRDIYYYPKMTEFLLEKQGLNYENNAFSFYNDSSKVHKFSENIESEVLKDLLLLDSTSNLLLDERIGNFSSLSELRVENYGRVVFPDSVKKMENIKKLKIVSNQMVGLENFKISLDAQNLNVVLSNSGTNIFNLSPEDKNNLYKLLIEGKDLKNYAADYEWRKFKNKFKNSIPFSANSLE